MNRGVVEQQQMMAGNSGWWNVNSLRQTPSQQPFHPLRSCTSSSMPSASWHESQNQLPESWSQLLMGGLNSEEDRCNFSGFQATKLENWEDHVLFPSSTSVHMAGVKQERSESSHALGLGHEEFQAIRPPWGQILLPTSPRSCVTSFSSNMLDFSSRKSEGKHQESDHSSECNSTVTGAPAKKAKVQSSSSQSTFKVRKEKLGDRITVLHQLVSPFGKTDTASVLLEALGYIRFLQSQIEALSSPYLGSASGSMSRPAQGERNCIFPEDPGQLLNDTCIKRSEAHDKMGVENGAKKDLRSRGLCLVPLSCTVHIVNDNSADYWATNIGGAGLLR